MLHLTQFIYERSHTLPSKSSRFRAILAFAMRNFADEITLEDLATAAGVSRFALCRFFKRNFSMSPMSWVWMFRATLARELIQRCRDWSLTDIAFACGFTSSAHFSRAMARQFGLTPSAMRPRPDGDEVSRSNKGAVAELYERDRELVLASARSALLRVSGE